MDRGYIYVNKKNFINNLQYLSQVSKKKTCLVVKANAYGHGIKWSVRNAREAGVEWFAVASIEEGIQVKQEFKDSRVLLLAEPSVGQLDNIFKNELDLTVYSDSFTDALIDTGNQYNVHLKIDTGMHRIGCSPEKFDYFLEKINDSNLSLAGICTHFPLADTDKRDTQNSIDLFNLWLLVSRAMILAPMLLANITADKPTGPIPNIAIV